MLAIHRRVVVAEGVRVRVCRTELTFSQFTAMVFMFRLHVSSPAFPEIWLFVSPVSRFTVNKSAQEIKSCFDLVMRRVVPGSPRKT